MDNYNEINNNENIVPLFDSGFSSQPQPAAQQPAINTGYDEIQRDLPPSLGEIKNLTDAPIADAPTGNVLGPMNVMPMDLPPADPLNAYDNGIKPQSNNTQNEFVYNVPHQVEKEPTSSVDTYNPNEQHSIWTHNNTSFPETSTTSVEGTSTPLQSNIEYEVVDQPSLDEPAYDVPNDMNIANADTKLQPAVELDSMSSEQDYSELPIQLEGDALDQATASDSEEDLIDMMEEEEPEDNSTTDEIIEEENLTDDTLSQTESASTSTEVTGQMSASEIFNKVKTLVESIKTSNPNVRTEEYDFTDIYKLVVKIEK